jgi:hypothetical protein
MRSARRTSHTSLHLELRRFREQLSVVVRALWLVKGDAAMIQRALRHMAEVPR